MAPAADMFEMGVKVQVLKRGTLFPMRATRLFELYRSRGSLDELTAAERSDLEQKVFRRGLDQVWQDCLAYFAARDPAQITRAEQDAKHRMALVFRWYLGRSSHWANRGEPDRQVDYQVWCGPAMGAFNQWCAGSDLADAKNRTVVTVARNLLLGAAVRTRAHLLRAQGVTLGATALLDRPLTAAELEERLL
jgi:PfaD family protein